MLIIGGVLNDFEQSMVTRATAAVFGWAAADSLEENDPQLVVHHGNDLFEPDGVRPVIAEVVQVCQYI
jgi:hypothetical protein